jgi:hypothetical protein
MEYCACEELEALSRRLLCAIERKNELIAANLLGKWMMAAEADLTRTHELIRNHRKTCTACSTFWQQPFNNDPSVEDIDVENYRPENRLRSSRAPHRRFYGPYPALILQFPSHHRHP